MTNDMDCICPNQAKGSTRDSRCPVHGLAATAAPLDRDGLRKQVKNNLLDYAHGQIISGSPIDSHVDAIMQLAEDYARSVIGEDEPDDFKDHGIVSVNYPGIRNNLRAEQRKRLEDRLQ